MKTLAKVADYMQKVVPLLGLNHWKIFIKESKEEGDGVAQTVVVHNYKTATIFINISFWEKSEELQEETIIHELIHCHTQFWTLAIKNLSKSPDQAENRIIDTQNTIIDAEEECVELLGRAIHKLIKDD